MREAHNNDLAGGRVRVPIALVLTGLLCLLLAAGCSPERYRRSADKEVYRILESKTPVVPGMLDGFSIDPVQEDLLAACPVVEPEPAPEQTDDPAERQATGGVPVTETSAVLSLAKALEVASLNSREYQTQKETLYLQALSLTLQRYMFDPQFFGRLSGDYRNTDTGDERQIGADTSFGFSWLLATGARVSVGLQSSFSEFLSGDLRRAASSLFQVSITQPILQGAGLAVTESLTQAERNVIYQIRSFVRFRRRFFVDVLSDYYQVLESLQLLENQQRNYENLLISRDRARAMGEAGRMQQLQVEQTEQNVLSSKDSVETRRQSYQARLDGLKVTLGLPTEAPVILDKDELQRLADVEALELKISLERATQIALENRLDLLTARDEVQDAERKLKVARNDLLPGLDLSVGLDTDTEGDSQPLNFKSDRTDFSAGIELDLPLDRLSERNTYRRRLIELDRARRNYEELRDNVVLQVRDSWRQFGRAKRSYEIQRESATLASRRVDSTELLLEAGRAITRDLLDARDDLLEALDEATAALVDYRVASLELARDMGILIVDEKGQLKENFEAYE